MNLLEELNKVEANKSEWEVIAPIYKPTEPVNPVVARCLELRGLELDVKDWTLNFSNRLSETEQVEVKSILEGHARDEDKHEAILEHLQNYWGGVEVSSEAKELIKEWVDLPCDSMVKKTFLEAGVFFSILPLLTRYSNHDGYTSRVADWIMIDEQRHVRSARLLMRYFSLKGSKKLLGLVEKTLRFILQTEPTEIQDKWVKRSLSIALSGKCDEFAEESRRVVVGHFDQETNKQVKNGYSY